MALLIKIRSARSIEVDGVVVIDEISYQYSDSDLGKAVIDTAMKLPTKGIDVNGDGFVDMPTVTNLVDFVLAVNTSLPGAEGCPNAHLTLIKQLTKKNADIAAPAVAEVESYEVEGVGIPDDDEEEV